MCKLFRQCHINDFQIIGYGGHFCFSNRDQNFYRHVFIAINSYCKFGENMFINERDIKVCVKI